MNIRFVDHLFDDMLIENAEVRVILPEGVSKLELSTPYPVKREQDGKHYTYLDTTGNVILIFFLLTKKSANQILQSYASYLNSIG